MGRTPESGLPVDVVYDESKLTDFCQEQKLGHPGQYPCTRGLYPRICAEHVDNGGNVVAEVNKFIIAADARPKLLKVGLSVKEEQAGRPALSVMK
jgi:hypothetical protein